MTLQDIEHAIDGLSPDELDQLYAWFDKRFTQQIDDRLASDIASGRFDDRISRALAEHKARKTRPL